MGLDDGLGFESGEDHVNTVHNLGIGVGDETNE